MMDIKTQLQHIDLFKDLSSQSQKALASICIKKKISKKKYLFLEGQKGEAIYVLDQGAIQLFKTTPEGKEVVIKMVQQGEMFAEVILFEEEHYPVTAVTLQDSFIYQIPKKELHRLLSNPLFRNDFIRILLTKQRYLANQIVYLTSHDVAERFFLFLKDHFGPKEEIIPSISKKEVAAIIGTSPETFSRLLLKMKKNGLVVWENKRIQLKKGFYK